MRVGIGASAGAVIAVTLGLAGPAAAAPRVAIGGVRNDPGGTVAHALERAVCPPLECAAASEVYAGKRIDFATARQNGVDAVLFGTVAKRGTGRVLALALLKDSFTPVRTWSLALDAKGRMDGRGVARDVTALLSRAPGASPAALDAPAAPAAQPRIAPEPAAEPVAVEPATPRGRGRPPAAPPAGGLATRAPSRGAVLLGVRVLQRHLGYGGASTTSPQGLSGGTMLTPTIGVEAFPFAESPAWYAGAGAFVSYGRSFGFEVAEVGGTKHSTVYTALEGGLAYRIAPASVPWLLVTPRVSFRNVTFSVASRTTATAALPDSRLRGPAAGLDVSAALSRSVRLLVSGGYTYWSTAGDLVGGGTFSNKGSASAIGGAAGFSLALGRALSVRVLGELEQTSYSLKGPATYPASSATDRYLGGRAEVRYAF